MEEPACTTATRKGISKAEAIEEEVNYPTMSIPPQQQSAQISDVTIVGSKRINQSFFANEFAMTKLHTRKFDNMEELQMALAERVQHMKSTDLFHNVDAQIRVPNVRHPQTGQELESGQLDFNRVH